MNIIESFRPSLEDRASQIGLEFADHQFTFAELDARSNRLARRFSEDGLVPGDRVVVYLANSLEFIVAYLAVLKIGLVFVPVNVLYREQEIQQIVDDAEPAAAITSLDLAECLKVCLPTGSGAESGNAPFYRTDDFDKLTADLSSTPVPCPAAAEDAAMIVYTSGTTGTPKGAVLNHSNLTANAQTLIEAWRITHEDRLLLALPLFHVHGLGNGVHTWLATGLRARLLERFRKETIADGRSRSAWPRHHCAENCLGVLSGYASGGGPHAGNSWRTRRRGLAGSGHVGNPGTGLQSLQSDASADADVADVMVQECENGVISSEG